MRGIGWGINPKVKVKKFGRMVALTKAIMNQESNKVGESTIWKMAVSTKVSGKTMLFMEKALWRWATAVATKETGFRAKCMGGGFIPGTLVSSIKGHITWIWKRDLVPISGKMGKDTLEIGKRISGMERDTLNMLTVLKDKVFGRMIGEWAGKAREIQKQAWMRRFTNRNLKISDFFIIWENNNNSYYLMKSNLLSV